VKKRGLSHEGTTQWKSIVKGKKRSNGSKVPCNIHTTIILLEELAKNITYEGKERESRKN
jgi:hypothetical protein